MIALAGLGALTRSSDFALGDLFMPTAVRDLGDQWTFGRGVRDDLDAAADTAAGDGIRRAASERQAALETLFAELVIAAHGQALDDASTQSPDVELFEGECQTVLTVMQSKIARLRFVDQAQAIAEQRAWVRSSVEEILAGPVLQWRTRLAAKFGEIAAEAHEIALGDCLRDIGPEHPTCSGALALMRLAIARERFS